MAQNEAFVQELAALLQGTLSADSNVRTEAEVRLKQLEMQPGYLSSLFQLIAVIDGVPIDIRQSGSIYLKNMVRRSWDHARASSDGSQPTTVLLDEGEKIVIRENLLEALVHSDPRVRPQVAETLKYVVMVDFPTNWQNLIPSVMRNLETGEDRRLLAALIALRNIAKVYEFKSERTDRGTDPREPLNQVVQICFPRLLEVNASFEKRIVDSGGMDEFAHMLQRYICKTFWSATEFALPPYILESPENFRKWMEALVTALRRPVPAECINGRTDPEDLMQVPAWKVKKWLGHIMHRYFQRYGDPKRPPKNMKNLAGFSEVFLREYAAPITSAMLEVLSWPVTLGTPISSRVANLALNYVDAAIVPAVTYDVISPNVEFLLTKVVFPYLCINDADAALWEEDPIEYVRKAYDVLEDFYSPRAAACNVVFTLGKFRAKRTILPFLNYLAETLNEYAAEADGTPKKEQLARRKDGVLLAIGHVKEKLLARQDLKENLQAILQGHVQPEFQSSYPFLRARVCWLFGQLASIDSDIMSAPMILMPALQGVIRCLNDPDFPVRVQAAVDIRFFLTNDSATMAIRPGLRQLFDHLFRLIDQVDNTEIIATIESLVQSFQSDIPQLATFLCDKLTATYLRAATAGEDDEESNLAAVQSLQAIDTILQSLAQHTGNVQLFQEIETVLSKVFEVMFDVDKMEFFEESLEVLSTFIYFSAEQNRVSPYLWTIYPKIFDAFEQWAFDYAEHLISPIDNYISLGTETFMNGRIGEYTYVDKVVQMIDRLWQEEFEDQDALQGTKLAEILILNCKGKIDETVGRLLGMIIHRMRMASSDKLRVRLLSNLGCALYYNAALTLRVLSQLGCVQDVFAAWLGNLQSFTRIHDKKASAVGLSSILHLPPEALPAEVRAGYSQVASANIELLRLIVEQRNARDAERSQTSLEMLRSSNGGADIDFDDGQDAEDDYTELLRQNEYDDPEDFFDPEDEGDFDSPLDDIDEVLYFAQSVKTMGEEAANNLMSLLQQDQQHAVRAFLQRAAQL
mmetsp:Transcript_4301/g.12984  ORF Transcript_4301/g.12984 Transcript_4301/m.12984 type:complete len:1030 (-) Transcript_4301:111-3200(-)|eukprot:CAMPEP_0198724532 /NCGR_PEP_ID=MMETSP1475-20131203/1990_1 /TAXON_ID= ORGANISM="Unidentified sp., Strain CCMP1999" /NCGR_SAMPLE_ID=MMETSP1475 /ASSEMBLY_ACC=CAM_ASM_001111 /LENGTH=1029 /DNA_ID=CAMNT_0044486083 /DNA_START=536 /DNA_END=3625 /DNA_ORIENTATION=-